MHFFQHPDVKDILAKRTAYEQAKDTFICTLLSEAELYTASHDTLTCWLDACVGDRALQEEICARVADGPPMIHWGSDDQAACTGEGKVQQWQLRRYFCEGVTCQDCRNVYEKDHGFAA
jgi:hypothetical protein